MHSLDGRKVFLFGKIKEENMKNIWLESSWLTFCIASPLVMFGLFNDIPVWGLLAGVSFIWVSTFISVKVRDGMRKGEGSSN